MRITRVVSFAVSAAAVSVCSSLVVAEPEFPGSEEPAASLTWPQGSRSAGQSAAGGSDAGRAVRGPFAGQPSAVGNPSSVWQPDSRTAQTWGSGPGGASPSTGYFTGSVPTPRSTGQFQAAPAPVGPSSFGQNIYRGGQHGVAGAVAPHSVPSAPPPYGNPGPYGAMPPAHGPTGIPGAVAPYGVAAQPGYGNYGAPAYGPNGVRANGSGPYAQGPGANGINLPGSRAYAGQQPNGVRSGDPRYAPHWHQPAMSPGGMPGQAMPPGAAPGQYQPVPPHQPQADPYWAQRNGHPINGYALTPDQIAAIQQQYQYAAAAQAQNQSLQQYQAQQQARQYQLQQDLSGVGVYPDPRAAQLYGGLYGYQRSTWSQSQPLYSNHLQQHSNQQPAWSLYPQYGYSPQQNSWHGQSYADPSFHNQNRFNQDQYNYGFHNQYVTPVYGWR